MNNDFEEGQKAYFRMEKFDGDKSEKWQEGWCEAWVVDYNEYMDRITMDWPDEEE